MYMSIGAWCRCYLCNESVVGVVGNVSQNYV